MLTGDDGLPLDAPPPAIRSPSRRTGSSSTTRSPARPHRCRSRGVRRRLRRSADALVEGSGGAARPEGPRPARLARCGASSSTTSSATRRAAARRRSSGSSATPSAATSVWLYAHRLTRDSLFQVQNDFVAPEARARGAPARRASCRSAGANPIGQAAQGDRRAGEPSSRSCARLLDEVKRVAPALEPDLDDGVVLTMAPLWRLVPQHKPWQKELKSTWDELCAGKYDWAHLAMHLWPERVVPKCATDRSLAIAHGLEDVFWVEGADGKWKPRNTPTRPSTSSSRAHLTRRQGRAEEPARSTRGYGTARRGRARRPRRCCSRGGAADAPASRLRREAARRQAQGARVVVWYDARASSSLSSARCAVAREPRAAGACRRSAASRRVSRSTTARCSSCARSSSPT